MRKNSISLIFLFVLFSGLIGYFHYSKSVHTINHGEVLLSSNDSEVYSEKAKIFDIPLDDKFVPKQFSIQNNSIVVLGSRASRINGSYLEHIDWSIIKLKFNEKQVPSIEPEIKLPLTSEYSLSMLQTNNRLFFIGYSYVQHEEDSFPEYSDNADIFSVSYPTTSTQSWDSSHPKFPYYKVRDNSGMLYFNTSSHLYTAVHEDTYPIKIYKSHIVSDKKLGTWELAGSIAYASMFSEQEKQIDVLQDKYDYESQTYSLQTLTYPINPDGNIGTPTIVPADIPVNIASVSFNYGRFFADDNFLYYMTFINPDHVSTNEMHIYRASRSNEKVIFKLTKIVSFPDEYMNAHTRDLQMRLSENKIYMLYTSSQFNSEDEDIKRKTQLGYFEL